MSFLKKYFFFLNKKKKVHLIDTDKKLQEILQELINENCLGIDTEFDWRNTYYPKLSLIQIATKSSVYLLDCLAIKEFEELKKILLNTNLLIFHSVRSDATVLSTALKIKVKNVFDIQIAEKIISNKQNQKYGNIVGKYFSIKLQKSETNSNWLKRPFTKKQIDYAADDVEYLISIFKKQRKILKNKLKKVLVESKIEASLGNQELFVSRFAKLQNANELERKIFMWREKTASVKNLPPSFIINNKGLKKVFSVCKFDVSLEQLIKLFENEKLAKSLFNEINK
tara:strand:+ start:33197 stop:34045 length:849 start_codon:yes stop_codon:yes gene_type:complete